MRRAIVGISLVLCVLAALASSAEAQVQPPIVNRPGATLLLPYFEVDLNNVGGQTTLFSVNNSSATAIMAHVVIWSDMGVPVFGFNVYLTGFDVQTMNLRDILKGTVPATASAGQDPLDNSSPTTGISNQGQFSQDINFASCTGILPPPPVPASYVAYMQSVLTGGPSPFHSGMCLARNHGTPGIARGYVTVNTATQCSLIVPGDPGYFFNGGGGVASNQNVMYGDYMLVNPSLDVAFGDALVQITAQATDPDLNTPGRYTFWGSLNAWTAIDNREPLSTNFAAQFIGPKDFKTPAKARRKAVLPPSTEIVVWRDPKVKVNPFTCGTTPSWYPLNQEQIVAFNDSEGTEVPTFGTPPFPGVTQRLRVGFQQFPLTFERGWLFLNLNTTVSGSPNPPIDPAASQAWVSVLRRVQQGPNGGKYDTGFLRATLLDSARAASHTPVIP